MSAKWNGPRRRSTTSGPNTSKRADCGDLSNSGRYPSARSKRSSVSPVPPHRMSTASGRIAMIDTKLETDCRTSLFHGTRRVLKGAVWLASLMALTPLHAQADVVTYFDEIATNTINAAAAPTNATPEEKRPVYFADLATVHVAIYDAVNAIVGGYEEYHV